MSLLKVMGVILLTSAIIFGVIFLCLKCELKAVKKKLLIRRADKAFQKANCKSLTPEDDLVINQDKCSICMETFEPGDEVTTLQCSHKFHQDCIKNWLFEKRTCPLCKEDALKSLGLVLTPREERFWQTSIVSRDPESTTFPISDMYDPNEEEDSTDEDAPPVNEENRRPDQLTCGCIMGHRHYE